MEIVPGGIEEQAQQVLKNLKTVVEASGSELGKVVKTTVSQDFVPCLYRSCAWLLLGYSGPHISDLPIFRKVFLKNMNDFAIVNGIYGNFFENHKPARSAVEVARLPKDVLVEVEAIAR